VDSPRPSIRFIAARCGCSRNTVSLALKGDPRVVASRARRIRRVAAEVGYRPDPKLAQMMSQIARRTRGDPSKLGILVGADFDRPDPWRESSTLDQFYTSMSRRMGDYGYTFDCFWLGQPRMTPARIRQIILHRGIEGLIVFSYASAPAVIDFDFSGFAASVIGRGLAHPRLDAAGSNLHNDLDHVVRNALRLGYQRIGLALPLAAAARSLHCWEAAYQFYQSALPPRARSPACVFDPEAALPLQRWLARHRPDCVVGQATTYDVLLRLGYQIPSQFGFATLVQDSRLPGLAGISLALDLIASKAVDIVVDRLRTHRLGLPDEPELTLYEGKWRDGPSLPQR
jgi:LacI family transcriptional regulator